MANALDYIAWRGDLTFKRDPINEVDMFLFSQLATPDYSGIFGMDEEMPLKEVASHYFNMHTDNVKELGALQSKCILPMLKAMAASKRFSDMKLLAQKKKIRPQRMEQFEATSMMPEKDKIVVSYRGTDDTLVGWKEDMYLAVVDGVGAQVDAVKYLTKIAAKYPEARICIVGHSKGGNLAIYSAVKAPKEIRDRIELVIGYDSPGFSDQFIAGEDYLEMKDRIVTVLSQHSIVGVLMNLAGRFGLAKSTVSGPLAHDGFNWEVVGTRFVRSDDLSDFSIALSIAIYDTLSKMDPIHKAEFIEELFAIFGQNGVETVSDMAALPLRDKISLISQILKNKTVRKFGAKLLQEMDKASKNMTWIRTELSKIMENIDDVLAEEKS